MSGRKEAKRKCHSSLCFDKLICCWLLRHASASTWTHSSCRRTAFTHYSNVQMCYTAEAIL